MAEKPVDRRRTPRQEVRAPVLVRSTDEGGRDFFERNEVLSVDRHGVRFRTRFRLKVGSEVDLQLLGQDGAKRMRVIWRGDTGSFEADLVGAEFVNPNDFWDEEALRNQ